MLVGPEAPLVAGLVDSLKPGWHQVPVACWKCSIMQAVPPIQACRRVDADAHCCIKHPQGTCMCF